MLISNRKMRVSRVIHYLMEEERFLMYNDLFKELQLEWIPYYGHYKLEQ